MYGHDIIVVGASLGGVETLIKLVSSLPADLDAAVFIVLHTTPHNKTVLDKILSRKTDLTVKIAEDKETIKCGYIYIAPPDHHLLIKENNISVTSGPRENWWRPSIDPLFRSAAVYYNTRVMGIILSGSLG